jgi:hypothetical protein
MTIDHDRFASMLAVRFPSVAEDIDSCGRGLLHLEMSAFARATQAAISVEDGCTVREHFAFIAEVYRQATPEVKNAIYVSYLEQLSFDGRHGKRIGARQMLSPELQAALRGLEGYLDQLFRKKGAE